MTDAIYDAATGRILRAGFGLIPGDGEALLTIEGAAAGLRVDLSGPDPVAVARPVLPVLPGAGAGGFDLAGLPEGSVVNVAGPLDSGSVEGSATIGASGALSVEAAAPGRYAVEIDPPWPWLPATGVVAISAGVFAPGADVLTISAPMVRLRAEAEYRVNDAAAAIRALIVAKGPGQDMIYLTKAAEARAVLALPDPVAADPVDYPLVAADVAVDGGTMASAAGAILTAAAVFSVAGAIIEELRRGANRAIRTAATPEEIATAEAGVTRAAFEARLLAAGIDPASIY